MKENAHTMLLPCDEEKQRRRRRNSLEEFGGRGEREMGKKQVVIWASLVQLVAGEGRGL